MEITDVSLTASRTSNISLKSRVLKESIQQRLILHAISFWEISVLVVHIKEHKILKITTKENVQLARPVPKAVPLQTGPRQHLLHDPLRRLHPRKRPKNNRLNLPSHKNLPANRSNPRL